MYAHYTVHLKTLLEDERAKEKIYDALSKYPLYEPLNTPKYGVAVPTREELNAKILNHFKYREIGFETPGRFIEELEIAMNEIMSDYNLIYKSIDITNGIDDIFGNLDVTETFDQETQGSSSNEINDNGKVVSKDTGSSETESSTTGTENSEETVNNTGSTSENGNSKQVVSGTPQEELSITAENIDSVPYADNVQWNKNNNSTSTNSSGTNTKEGNNTVTGSASASDERNTETTTTNNSNSSGSSSGTNKHTLTRKGNQGVNTYAHDLLEFRELAVNVERQILNDSRLQELFMMVY